MKSGHDLAECQLVTIWKRMRGTRLVDDITPLVHGRDEVLNEIRESSHGYNNAS